MFLLISRTVTDDITKKLQSLLNAGIDAYVIVDKDFEPSTKRFIRYDNKEIEDAGFLRTNVSHRTQLEVYKITGWDKALYHAYKSKEKYVWICEDDMYWNRPGVVKMILDAAETNKHDLIAGFVLSPSYEETPRWYHWTKAEWITPDKSQWIGTYNQLCRVSKPLLQKIAEFAQERKELILHEALLPMLCKMNKLKFSYLEDLRLPIHYDIRWMPDFYPDEIEDLSAEHKYFLIHPVKSKEANKLKRKEHLLSKEYQPIKT